MIQDAIPVSVRRGLTLKKEVEESLRTHLFHRNRRTRPVAWDNPGLQRFWKESTNGQAGSGYLNSVGAQNMKGIGMVAVNDLIDFGGADALLGEVSRASTGRVRDTMRYDLDTDPDNPSPVIPDNAPSSAMRGAAK